ncbi:MAG: preprotein translocase subunit SecE [Actinomycetota bacterium]
MNRQMKRAQQRQGSAVERAQAATAARRPQAAERRGARGAGSFLREVRRELGQVIWPTRTELLTYTVVVLVTVVVLTAYVFGLDALFSRFVISIFGN